MNATHTPGAWRLGDAGFTVFGPNNGQPAPKVIAKIPGNRSPMQPEPSAEGRANARLIAACPDMLAALRALEGELVAALGSAGMPLAQARAYPAIKQARAAIAKATGE